METTEVTRTFDVRAPMHRCTMLCIDRLKDGPIGSTIQIEELEKLIDRKIDTQKPDGKRGYGYLRSAIRHVLNSYGYVWFWIAGQRLIRCLDVTGKLELSIKDAKKTGRVHRKDVRRLETVNLRELDNETREKVVMRAAMSSTMALMMSGRTAKALEERGIAKALELPELLSAFTKA